MRFDKVIVVGSNKVACDCIKIVCGEVGRDKIVVLETSNDPISMVKKISKKNNVRYCKSTSDEEITEFLKKETYQKKSLIISANNRYIFKRGLISENNVVIINFHYALLPDYRGVNIPSWVIYNNEKETGVTWHYVTEEIDHGNILNEKRISIGESTTAFDIVREGMRLSGIGFSEFFPELIIKGIPGNKVGCPASKKIYLSKELPNDGFIKLDDPINILDRVLRAYDYHGLGLMPKLKLKDGDMVYQVESYNVNRDVTNKVRGVGRFGDTFVITDQLCQVVLAVKKISKGERDGTNL